MACNPDIGEQIGEYVKHKISKQLIYINIAGFKWCPGAESNHRHEDFQSTALPTELPGRKETYKLKAAY